MTDPKRRRRAPLRVPAFTVVPLGALAGWFAADWMGAILGLAIGVVLWRTRA